MAVLMVSFYGIIDEFQQMFTEGRSVEFKDWVADTSGAVLASFLYLKWDWYRSILEKRPLEKIHLKANTSHYSHKALSQKYQSACRQ